MRNMIKTTTKLLLTFGILLTTNLQINGQCMTLDVPLDQRISEANLIVDGEIEAQKCFKKNGVIYTENTVKIYQIFKGTSPATLRVITLGGQVGDDILEVHPALQLSLGQSGTLFLSQWKKDELKYEAIFDGMGFIGYDRVSRKAHDLYHQYGDINSEFLALLKNKLNGEIKIINTPFYQVPSFGRRVVPVITNISSTTTNAGADEFITITGSNFGFTQGTGLVDFRNSNDGGSGWEEGIKYKSWNDGKIEVFVPSQAGTGTIRVTNNSSDNAISTQTLTIPYANLNAIFNDEPLNPYVTQHTEDNGTNNDFNWQFNSQFFDSTQAKDAFIRSLETWRCGTLMPWNVVSNTTSVSDYEANDGINLVSWDNSNTLPTNVLGRCYSKWQACGPTGSRSVYVSELDIVFNISKQWHYALSNASGGKFDFVTVCAHELGHGHQLGHVIDNSKIMHYSVSTNQTKRSLSQGDKDGGNNVHARSTTAVCFRDPLVLLNSNNCSLVGSVVGFTADKTDPCLQEEITFTDATTGAGITWTWSFGANANPSTAIGIGPHQVEYSTGGQKTVSLTVTTLSGPITTTKNNFINVNSAPKVKANVKFSNFGNNLFRFYSENGSGYQNDWFFNNRNDSLIDADTIYLTFPSPGNYTLSMRSSNNCNDTTITVNLTDWTGLENLFDQNILVYPNPANNEIHITSDQHQFNKIIITDLAGRIVLSSSFTERLNISSLEKGMYLLTLENDKTTLTTKLIKE